MVKPLGKNDNALKEASRPRSMRAAGAIPSDPGSDTKTKILDAAFQRLAREGYGALSMREIAKDAGVNHALINYHYRTKDQLVIAVLDAVNERLLDRQQKMYRAPGAFAEKWAQARRFYENDLASGFCRVMMELVAASMSNPGLRDQLRPRLLAWHRLVLDAVREAISTYQLDLPVSAEVITCWICNFWIGMELAMLTGMPEADATHREALEAMQRLLEDLDRRASEKGKRPSGTRTS